MLFRECCRNQADSEIDQIAADDPDRNCADGLQAERDELRAGGAEHSLNFHRVLLCVAG